MPATAARVALLDALPPLARTMVRLALLTGLRRGELFALRWKSVSLAEGHLTVDEAVYEGAFGTPKMAAGLRRVPWTEAMVSLLAVRNVVRKAHFAQQHVTALGFPACATLNLPNATWLTFRRTYASWARDQGVPGKVVARLMGHTNADVRIVHEDQRSG